jgi:hypothetical protein
VKGIDYGLVTGTVNEGGEAMVTNDAKKSFLVSVVTYASLGDGYFDAVPYSSFSMNVSPNETLIFGADTPDCVYRMTLLCGPPVVEGMGEKRTIASIYTGGNPCTPQNISTTPKVSASVEAIYLGNLTYNFTCTSSGFQPKNYSWSFGDLQSAVDAGETVTHTYPKKNTFVASCTVSNGKKAATSAITVEVT